jgi:large repetitive protein
MIRHLSVLILLCVLIEATVSARGRSYFRQTTNEKPVINGQYPLATNEEQSLTIALSDLTVKDPDNIYPDDFLLTVKSGDNYGVSGTTITPSPEFNGTLTVPVSVNDGINESDDYPLSVAVVALNDPPVITGQSPLSVGEEQSLIISLNDLTVSDPDNAYPTDFTLLVSEGSNYSLSGNTITPVLDYNGMLSIPVQVNDGTNWSESFNLQVEVIAENDAPVIAGQTSTLTVSENQSQELTPDHLQVTDPDNSYPTDFSLTVYSGDNYTVSGNTVTPTTGYNGMLSVPVSVSDGLLTSNIFNVAISVSSVNDPPVIIGQTTLTINEETPLTIVLTDLVVSDNDNTYPGDFTLDVMSGENYSVAGATITPAAEFSGALNVPVTVNDGSSSSAVFNLQVTVVPVNDAPVITDQAPLSIAEDQPFVFDLAYLTVSDPDNTYPNDFSLSISPGSNYTVNGSTITPQADFTGALGVPVAVSDGLNLSNTFNVQITVNPSDDAPVITGQQTVQVNEDESINISISHLVVSDPDNPGVEGLTITLQPGTNYTVSGTTVTPSQNFTGVLSIPVTVSDGVSASNPFPLQVDVLPVNDKPVIAGQAVLSTYKNEEIVITFEHLIVEDVDNQYPNGFSLTLYPGQHYSNFGNTILPVSDYIGKLSVPVSVNDGTAESDQFILQIDVVAPPNVPPIIQSQVKLTTYEQTPITIQLSHLIVDDPDNIFPADFTLYLAEGSNYTITGTTVTPAQNFSGMLTIPVRIKDKEAFSPTFNLKVEVLPVADVPLITSQNYLAVAEDDSLTLSFEDLVVIDPDDNYPVGFTMAILPGEHYAVSGMMVKPAPDYSGYISVPVSVSDGENSSEPYQLMILVEEVNDVPVITDSENGVQYFGLGNGPLAIFDTSVITDVDTDSLMYGEVSIGENFEQGLDSLVFTNTPLITGAFDSAEGILVFFGKASIEDYQFFIRGISYLYDGIEKPTVKTRSLTLSVNDGIASSSPHGVQITFDAPSLPIDVPSGFTPNGDGVNDTWSIKLPEGNQTFESAVVRVYNKRGVIIFEAEGFARDWDGTANGSLLPADTYFYTIDLHSRNFRNQYKGIITLLR